MSMRLKQYGIAGLILLILLLGCDNGSPELELKSGSGFVSNDTILNPGISIRVGIFAESNGVDPLNRFILSKNLDILFDTAITERVYDLNMNITKGTELLERWTFSVADRAGHIRSDSISIARKANVSRMDVIQLGMQANLLPPFYSLEHLKSFDETGATNFPDSIDLITFFNRSDSTIVLASPGTIGIDTVYPVINGWSARNTTLFHPSSISVEDFDTITSDWYVYQAIGIPDNSWLDQIRAPEERDVLYIKFLDRFGLIKIDTFATSVTGSLEFDVVKQSFTDER
jgi:hypothetical protein